ncbi:hypothetical protein LTR87_012304 [Friedmanniomyces endolithicus]|nr:hypothetical protein LTR87_012304 [Friedmanniomyces endolithicus]
MANIHTPIPNLKLNDGNSIPMIGFGTGTAWYKSGDESKIDQVCIDSAVSAQKLGYYHLYLIHAPFFSDSKADHQHKWKQMEDLKEQGLTKSIGVSNYFTEHLDYIFETCKVPPAINQIEFHPYLQRTELIKYHKAKGIATEAYGPLTPVTKGGPGPVDDVLASLARKYAVNPGEILLRWCIDQDIVPITTSGKEQRLSDYLRAMTFKLNPKEIQQINEAGSQKHFRGFWNHKLAAEDHR